MDNPVLKAIQKSHPDAVDCNFGDDGSLIVTMTQLASTRDIWLGSNQYKLVSASAGLSQENRGNLFVKYLPCGEA